MRFLTISALVCVVSFSLSGIFGAFADFDSVIHDAKSGKYSFNFNSDGGGILEEKTMEFEKQGATGSLTGIAIRSAVSEIKILPTEGDKVILKTMLSKEVYEEHFEVKTEGGVLQISTESDKSNRKNSFSSLFGNNKNESRIELSIPKDLILDYALELALGDIEISDLEANKISLEMAAGDIDFKNIKMVEGSIEAAAGDIDLEKIIVSKSFAIEAAAGDVDLEMNQEAPNVEIEAAAGDIDFSIAEGLKPNLVFENSTTIGDLEVRSGAKVEGTTSRFTYGDGKGKVVISTTFGDVKFK